MRKLGFTFFLVLVALPALAQEGLMRLQDPVPNELQFIGYAFFRNTYSNISPTNELLQGQVIGRLFGPNSTTTSDRTSSFTEQRFIPFFVYRPAILDGLATFRTMFKVDYTWGDRAYGAGNNSGGAISGGQVNIQTLMANVSLKPHGKDWNVVLGMQRMFDNARDPNVNTVDLAQNSGYKLMYWGTQAVGASAYWNANYSTKIRFGYFQLWENLINHNDDVSLTMLDIETRPGKKTTLGFNAWYVMDRGKETGGISILGQGLTSQLADYNGADRIRLPGSSQKYHADIVWLGTNFSYGRNFIHTPLWVDGFVNVNIGAVDTLSATGSRIDFADVFGLAANLRVSYKYGMTGNDKIVLEGLFTTGDGNGVSDRKISSVITGNTWGSPVGIFTSHRALLLFPDPQVVNRYYSMVHDISNMGFGVSGLFLSAYRDLIPNKFFVKTGVSTALANYAPQQGGAYMGTEFNVEAKYNLGVFLTLGASVGHVWMGEFYDAPSVTNGGVRPNNPWVGFLTLSWLMF